MLSAVWMALFLLCIPAAHAQCDFAVTPGNPYTEGFENGISCWTTEYVMDNIDWEVVTSMDYGPVVTPHGGTHCAQFFYEDYDVVTTRLVSPVIDLSAVDFAALSFWHAQGAWWSDQNTLKVYYRTSPTEEWIQLAHYTNDISSWTREEISLSSLSATFQIAFEGIGNYGYPIVLDDITIERLSSCTAPTNVAAINVMPTFADITWESDNAANWDVEYGVTGFTHGNGTIISTTTQSCNLPSLTPNTSYDVYVRSFCNDGEQSNWSQVLTISTALCTPAPTTVDGFGITSVTFGQVQEAHNTTHPSEEPFYGDYTDVVGVCAAGTSATVDITYNTGWTYGTVIWVNWNNDCVFTDDEVVYTGESTDDEPTTLSCTFTIPANTPIGSYTMRIGGSDSHFDDMIADNEGFDPCYSGNYTIYEDYTLQIAEPPTCLAPSNLTLDTLDAHSATLDWTANDSESEWEIIYNGQTVTVTEHPYILSGLTPATDYSVRVRALCSATDSSFWSPVLHFTTGCDIVYITDNNSYTQNFDGTVFPPVCWERNHTAGTSSYLWERVAYTTHNNSAGAACLPDQQNGNKNDLVTPQLNIPEANMYQVTFWMYRNEYNTNKDKEGVKVWVNTTPDTVGGTEIAYIHREYTLDPAETAEGWYLYEAVIPSAGNMYVIFEGISQYGASSYIDDITVEPMPSCPKPRDLAVDESSITTTSATISWTDYVTPELGYEVEVNGTIVPVTSNPATLALSPSTDYTVRVRAICAADDNSDWSATINFATECEVISTFPYTQDFTSTQFPPVCWSQERTAVGSGSGTDYPDGAWNRYAYSLDDNSTPMAELRDTRAGSKHNLVMPPMNFTYAGGYEFSIDVYRTEWGTDNEGVRIFVCNSDTIDENATELGFISNSTNAASSINGDIIGTETTDGWFTYELPIENLTGTHYIIIEGNSQYGTSTYIDNIVVREMPTCRKPTGVAVNNVSQNSAEISWTAQSGETSWEIEVNGQEIIPASANPYTFTNLDADEDYTIRVRAVCSETDNSDWSAAASFATYMCEPAPTSVDNNGITSVSFGQTQVVNQTSGHPINAPVYADFTSVVGDAAAGTYATIDITYSTGWTYGTVIWVNWNNDLALTDDEVVVTGTSTSSSPSTLHLSFYVPANTPLGNYTMRIGGADSHLDAAINAGSGYDPCYEGSYAIYEDYTLQITEAPSCLMPIDLTVDSITTNTATISWNALGDETSWVVRVDGVDEVVTTNPYTITGLPSSSMHTVSVAALCSATDTSMFCPTTSFFTECEVVVVDDSNEYNYGFEDEIFGCWTIDTDDPDYAGWELSSYGYHSGSQAANFISYDQARLISPVLDLTGISTEPQLTFWHMQPSSYGSLDNLSVYYRTSANDQWMLLTTYTSSITTYQSDTILLPANTYQFCFFGNSNYGGGITIDDIRISAALPPCEAPINVAIDQYGTITWEDTGEGLNWTIYYSINGVENTVNAANNIYTLSGLNEGDLIAASVQANCSENRTSPLSVTITSTYTTGIANYNALEAKVFPNPTTGNVHISLAHTNLSQMEVQVFDIFGKKVMTQMVESEDFDLDFSAFAPGMYMMRIGNANQFAQVKVVKE